MVTVDQPMGANQDDAGPPTVGSAYQGERGRAYFDWQDAKATSTSAEIDLFKFTPHVRPSDTVVDFGCGAGQLLARLQVARRIGIEANPHARAAAAALGIETARRSLLTQGSSTQHSSGPRRIWNGLGLA